MVRLIDEVKRIIRSKTKDEWQAWFGAQLAAARIYIQQNGEKSALAGFLVGIFIILFYKLFIFILTLLTLAYLIIITVADADSP